VPRLDTTQRWPNTLLVTATTAVKAMRRPGDGASATELVAVALGNLHNTAVFDATGHPALSAPVTALSDGVQPLAGACSKRALRGRP
jgi:hypothetical protein